MTLYAYCVDMQVKHLERKTGEDIPLSEVAKYLQDRLQTTHSSLASSSRLASSMLTSSGSLPRPGLRFDTRANSSLSAQGHDGNSEDEEEDPRARRRRR